MPAAVSHASDGGAWKTRHVRRLRHTAFLALAAVASVASCAAEPAPDATGAARVAAPASSRQRASAPAASGATGGSTYYVRPDGGDASQCTGRSDAAYPGGGRDRACAWKHPFFALPPGGKPRISGGDTLFIAGGSYEMGPAAPGANGCDGLDCYMAAIPSGNGSARTRVLGKPGARPVLWGSGGAARVLNLDASSNVEVGNLEITDRSDCVTSHSKPAAACGSAGRGATWAMVGVYAKASRNVLLHDLDIHGLASTGVKAGGLRDWTVTGVRIRANGRAGWDGNVGKTASANAGAIVLRNVEIAWNGCGERWKTGQPWACWGQKTGGYGDGLGTYYTGGQWLIEDSFIHHNTSDGLDLRYMDGEDGTRVTVRRLYAVGNAGNQVKVRGNAVIEDSVLVGQCGYFRGRDNDMIDGDHCRAGGNTLQLVLTPGDRVSVRRNTITGEGGALVAANEGDASARIELADNVLVGAPRMRKPGRSSSAYYANQAPAAVAWSGNLLWRVDDAACPPRNICGRDPKLASTTLDDFDAQPLAGSPVGARTGPPPAVARGFRHRARAVHQAGR